jgi:tetratricopeptide (TPR) repeat protein
MSKQRRKSKRVGRGRARTTFALFLLAMSTSSVAHAEPNATELSVARKLFQEASELESREDFEGARKKLRSALEIKDTPGLRFHLGYCAEQLGEFVTALLEYDRALDLVRGGQSAPDVERQILPARERVQLKIARLSLFLPPGVSLAKVWLDGDQVAPVVLGRPAPLDPGRHRIKVEALGYEPFEVEITLAPGQSQRLDLPLKKQDAAVEGAQAPATRFDATSTRSAAPAAPQRDAGSGIGAREIVLVSEATVAVAGLSVGIGFLLSRRSAESRIENAQTALDLLAGDDDTACSDVPEPGPCADLREAIGDYDSAGTISTVGFIAGGVGAAATLVTYLAWPTASDDRAVVVGPARAGLGLAAAGQF